MAVGYDFDLSVFFVWSALQGRLLSDLVVEMFISCLGTGQAVFLLRLVTFVDEICSQY